MTELDETRAYLTAVTLRLFDATDVAHDVRAVRERALLALTDLDPELVADLLILGAANGAGIEPDVPGLVARWGADYPRSVAGQLIEVLAAIAEPA